jgi:Fe-S oxidoreductase
MAKRLELPLRALPARQTLVHGHCHQKAVGAMKSMRRVLKLIPQHDFEMIDSGCCGMAGTFSLESEHQAIGRKMAERELLPAINQNAQARIVANGFSCRQQMRACGDTRPQHLALLLRDAMHFE